MYLHLYLYVYLHLCLYICICECWLAASKEFVTFVCRSSKIHTNEKTVGGKHLYKDSVRVNKLPARNLPDLSTGARSWQIHLRTFSSQCHLKLEFWKLEPKMLISGILKFWQLEFWHLEFWHLKFWHLEFWHLEFLHLEFWIFLFWILTFWIFTFWILTF